MDDGLTSKKAVAMLVFITAVSVHEAIRPEAPWFIKAAAVVLVALGWFATGLAFGHRMAMRAKDDR